ncbi:caspase family protein [Fertoebacter nigrum]|uniref:Caspase family protein n=2 Tax=Fertoeibacter niger TaxID=2656921 RepID=A0A8X8H0V6_9RHOB|nr:caspase family protein [Fertoeibacter niger]
MAVSLAFWLLSDLPSAAQEIARFIGHADFLRSVAFGPNGDRVLTGSGEGVALLWDIATEAEIRRFVVHVGGVHAVAFNLDGTRLLTGGSDNIVRLWDAATGAEVQRFTGHGHWVTSVAFSTDGRQLLSGSMDDTARLWDAATGTEIRRFTGHRDGVTSVAFSPDGAWLLTGSIDNTARLWDAANGTEIRRFTGHGDIVRSVAFSPDGQQVLTGSADKTARLWNVATGAEIRLFNGHGNEVMSVAFSSNGAQVLTGSWDDTARLWDTATGAEIMLLTGHDENVNSVAFSPDGRKILTGSSDNTARLWAIPEELLPITALLDPVESAATVIPPAPDLIPIQPRTDVLALIIGNHRYQAGVPTVDFADRDAEAMHRLLVERLGFPSSNVRVLSDMTLSQMQQWFGTAEVPRGILHDVIPSDITELLIYYSGHGVPGPSSGRAPSPFLLPVDGLPGRPELTAYPLDTLLSNLAGVPVERVSVFLDACFTGATPAGTLQTSTSGSFAVGVARPDIATNVFVLSATGFEEEGRAQMAHWLTEEKHGAFTWHLMAALDGAANSNGDAAITMAELHAHVRDALRREAFSGRIGPQSPTLEGTNDEDPVVVRLLGDN